MIHVIATIRLNPGTRGAFLQEFRRLMPAVHAEVGCIEYGPAIDSETDLPNQLRYGPDTVIVVEKWTDLSALKAHSVAPHMNDYRVKVKDYIVSVDLCVLDPAG